MTPLNKIRKLAEWDAYPSKSAYIYRDLQFPNRNSEPCNEFEAGAKFQHSKLSPIIEALLKCVEMQSECLKEIGKHLPEYPSSTELEAAQTFAARTTQAEVEKILGELG